MACLLPAPAAAADDGAILVMPLALTRFDPELAWLGEGVAIGLTSALADRSRVVVTRDERLAALDRLQLPDNTALTRATVIKLGELVGASAIVLGDIEVDGSTLALQVRVLELEKATLGAPVTYKTSVAGLLDACGRAAEALTRSAAITANRASVLPPMPAFEAYVRGLVARGDAARARYLKQAVALAPQFVDARLALWDLHTERGEHEQALAALPTPAAQADPTAAGLDARVRQAATLLRLRRYDDAFAALKALQPRVAETPFHAAVVANMMGVIQLRRGWTPQTGRPAYYFNQAVELDGSSADYAFNLGYAYWLDKDAMAAAYWLREAVRRTPSDGDAHFVLAAALGASGASTEGGRERELARRLSARWEKAATDELPRGLERLADRLEPSRTLVDAALTAGAERNQRDLAAFHVDTARRAYDAGHDAEAIRELRRALYLTPYDGQAHLLLGRALARSGLLSEAAGALKIAVWSDETPEALVALGDVLWRQRDADGAKRAADRAAELAPADAEVRALQARIRGGGGGA